MNLQDLLKPWEKRMRRRNESGPDPDQSGTGIGQSIVVHWYYPRAGAR